MAQKVTFLQKLVYNKSKMNKLQYYTLFFNNQKLVGFIYSKHFLSFSNIKEDLFQCGYLGLWKACKKFDDSKSKFTTFACRCIKNEMMQFINKENKYINLIEFDNDVDYLEKLDNGEYDLTNSKLEVNDILQCASDELKQYYNGVSIKDIARQKTIKYNILYRRLNNEKNKLRRKYE